ncbi:unnamed protein product [Discosporangium mesarthrocarpum]
MYASSSFVGYSLWLVADDPARSDFLDIITTLSQEHSTPKFEPHITLIAGVEPPGGQEEVLRKTKDLAAKIEPITTTVEACQTKGLYFQSIFGLVKQDEALFSAHKTSRAAFGQDTEGASSYMPHISLLYGDLDPPVRDTVISTAEGKVVGKQFPVSSVEVWSTKGVVSEWFRVGTFPLGGGKVSVS